MLYLIVDKIIKLFEQKVRDSNYGLVCLFKNPTHIVSLQTEGNLDGETEIF